MTRRGATLLMTALLTLGIGVGGARLHVPYVGLGPGPVTNTLGSSEGKPLIEVSGRKTYPAEGHLDLTTVNVYSELDLGTALRYWFDDMLAVVPREVVFPPNQTEEQSEEQNRQEMIDSQEHAVTAALRELKVPVTVKLTVTKVSTGMPAAEAGVKQGDVILAADDVAVDSATELREVLTRRTPGKTVELTIERDGTRTDLTVGTAKAGDDPNRPVIGVELAENPTYPFEITIQLENVGGPSAGLMFALGIIDVLTPGNLTGGKHIAGTGTIDDAGEVGPIGGIQQKLVGAKEAGADYFLVPAENWEEATAAPQRGLELVKVATLTEALAAVRRIAGSSR